MAADEANGHMTCYPDSDVVSLAYEGKASRGAKISGVVHRTPLDYNPKIQCPKI